MVTTFLTIFLVCSAVAIEIEKCDTTIQFPINDSDGTNIYKNFTKQYFEINEKPVYYSMYGPKDNWNQTTIWWSKENSSWFGKTEDEKEIWKILWNADEIVSKSKCLDYNSNCLGIIRDFIKINEKNVERTNPCKFPFKYKNAIYHSCTRKDSETFWCATSVDSDLEWQLGGTCTESCPLEGITVGINPRLIEPHTPRTSKLVWRYFEANKIDRNQL